LDSRYEATKESTGRLKLIHWRFNFGVGISGCYIVSVRFSPTSKIYYMQGGAALTITLVFWVELGLTS